MEFRHLGRSGLKISEITYGNWVTHGSQVDDSAAFACVHKALDLGITTFDTADVYAGTKAETVLGKALEGQRREGLEIFTKVYWPTGDGPNDRGLSRKGKALYIGVSEWTADQIRAAVEIADAMGFDRIVSSQPQYSMLWRVIESEVVPTSDELGIGQIVWSPMAQGVLSGKYLPGQPPPAGSRATDEASGSKFIARLIDDDVLLQRVQDLKPIASDLGLSMPQLAIAWVLQNANVSAALVGATRPEQLEDNVKASGVKLEADVLARIDEILADSIERDPSKTVSPAERP